jgi:hypothetical protein
LTVSNYPAETTVIQPARGLRQVRQLRQQDRRSPKLERAAAERKPDRQAVAMKQERVNQETH